MTVAPVDRTVDRKDIQAFFQLQRLFYSGAIIKGSSWAVFNKFLGSKFFHLTSVLQQDFKEFLGYKVLFLFENQRKESL